MNKTKIYVIDMRVYDGKNPELLSDDEFIKASQMNYSIEGLQTAWNHDELCYNDTFIRVIEDDTYKAVIKELQDKARDAKECIYSRAAYTLKLDDLNERDKLFDLDENPYTDWEDRENQEYDKAVFKTCNSILEKFNEEQVSESEEIKVDNKKDNNDFPYNQAS